MLQSTLAERVLGAVNDGDECAENRSCFIGDRCDNEIQEMLCYEPSAHTAHSVSGRKARLAFDPPLSLDEILPVELHRILLTVKGTTDQIRHGVVFLRIKRQTEHSRRAKVPHLIPELIHRFAKTSRVLAADHADYMNVAGQSRLALDARRLITSNAH